MYDIIMCSWGGTERVLMSELTLDEAVQFCEDNNWAWDTGYIWDLRIEEHDNPN